MTDLRTRYLGLELRTPLVASSSPLAGSVAGVRRLEAAGLSAVVLPSLFEEQTRDEARVRHYVDLVKGAKEAAGIPIIASLNGTSADGWVAYAREIEAAGADALELNLYYLPRDLERPAEDVERGYLSILESVRAAVRLPLALKLGPFFTSLGSFARRAVEAGADGLVLFNRFYQPDVNLEDGRVFTHLLLSTESDLRLPLRWIGLLHGRVDASFAATGGVYTAQDALKVVGVGAHVAMLCSALLRYGLAHVARMEEEMLSWMEACEYPSVEALRGRFSHARSDDPAAFERAHYIEAVRTLPPGAEPPHGA